MEKVVNHLIPPMRIIPKVILRNKWVSEENIQQIKSPILFIKCIVEIFKNNYIF